MEQLTATYKNINNITIYPQQQQIITISNNNTSTTPKIIEILPQTLKGVQIMPTIDNIQTTNNITTTRILIYNTSTQPQTFSRNEIQINPIPLNNVTTNNTIMNKIFIPKPIYYKISFTIFFIIHLVCQSFRLLYLSFTSLSVCVYVID